MPLRKFRLELTLLVTQTAIVYLRLSTLGALMTTLQSAYRTTSQNPISSSRLATSLQPKKLSRKNVICTTTFRTGTTRYIRLGQRRGIGRVLFVGFSTRSFFSSQKSHHVLEGN